jgi:hypothetical protein
MGGHWPPLFAYRFSQIERRGCQLKLLACQTMQTPVTTIAAFR